MQAPRDDVPMTFGFQYRDWISWPERPLISRKRRVSFSVETSLCFFFQSCASGYLVAHPVGSEVREVVQRSPLLYGLDRHGWALDGLRHVIPWMGRLTRASISK